MIIVRLRLTIAGEETSETMFPPEAPFFFESVEASGSPTPLPHHRPETGR